MSNDKLVQEVSVFFQSKTNAAPLIGLERSYLAAIIRGEKKPGKHATVLLNQWLEKQKEKLNKE